MNQLDVRLLVFVVIALVSLVIVSILFSGEDRDTGRSSVTLVIHFGDHHPSGPHPRNHTIWENGRMITTSPSREYATIYEFRGIVGENQSVLDVLRTAGNWSNISVDTTAYPALDGMFVDAIAGVENGDANWRYTINGEYGTRASDLRKVEDHDRVVWQYR